MSQRKSHDQFLKDISSLYNDEYIILGNYINSKKKILIQHSICLKNFEIRPNDILTGHGCPRCAGKYRKNTEDFKEEVFNLTQDEYVVLGDYISALKKIKIKHNLCNHEFVTRPNNFLSGFRCPYCRESKGEKRIRYFLDKNNINFKIQYKIENCKNIKSLPFDFAIFDNENNLKCLIEYDGKLHYPEILREQVFNHYKKSIEKTKITDKIKTQYCADNNIILIRIPYWDFDNIEIILNKEFNYLLIVDK